MGNCGSAPKADVADQQRAHPAALKYVAPADPANEKDRDNAQGGILDQRQNTSSATASATAKPEFTSGLSSGKLSFKGNAISDDALPSASASASAKALATAQTQLDAQPQSQPASAPSVSTPLAPAPSAPAAEAEAASTGSTVLGSAAPVENPPVTASVPEATEGELGADGESEKENGDVPHGSAKDFASAPGKEKFSAYSAPAEEALLKVSSLIQRFAEGRNDGKTPVQVLKRTLALVAEDAEAVCCSIHIISPDYDHGMLLAIVGTPGDCLDDLGFQEYSRYQKFATQKILNNNLKMLSWDVADGPPEYKDWQQLIQSAGLKHISAVPIQVSSITVAILTIGFLETEGWFMHPIWSTYMQLIASSLASSIKHSSMPKYLSMVHDIHESPDLDSLLRHMVSHYRTVLGHMNNQHVWYRVALSSQIGSAATSAMIFDDVSQLPSSSMRGSGTSGSISKSETGRVLKDILASGGITRTPVNMSSTILRVCIQHKQQVMVPDVQKLLNQSGCVSTDVFNNRLFKPPTSVLVFPLRVRQNIFGAVYCMSSVKSDFSDVAIRIREVADFTAPHLMYALKNRMAEEYAAMREASLVEPGIGASYSRDGSPGANGRGSRGSIDDQGVTGSCIGIGGCGSDSFAMAQSRSSTGALVTGLTEKLNEKRILSSMDLTHENILRDLQIKQLLGEGGFAKVFKGMWQGIVVGVKVVCVDGKNTKMDMKNAHEIAILSTISHPNIIQAYKCITDIAVSDLLNQCMRGASPQVLSSHAYRYLFNNQDKLCHIEVIEFCDRGNLASALQNQIFINVSPNGSRTVAMPALLTCLLEIASAMAELHRMGVVHCDLKPPNILLKSSNLDFKGYSAKVSDFGLSRVEDDETTESFPFNSCGTAAYVAPEALVNSKKVNSSVDVYAYGILMWELYTAQRPYSKMSQKEVVEEVVLRGLRPKFPDSAPADFCALAQACWNKSPGARPKFVDVIQTLNRILESWTISTETKQQSPLGPSRHSSFHSNDPRHLSNSMEDPEFRAGSGTGASLLGQRRAPSSSSPSKPAEGSSTAKRGEGRVVQQATWNRAINKGTLNLLELQQRR